MLFFWYNPWWQAPRRHQPPHPGGDAHPDFWRWSRQWPPLITSDCEPEKTRPKKSYCARRSVVFLLSFSCFWEKYCAAQLQPKIRRWTLVLSTMSSFVGQWVLSPLCGPWVSLPWTENLVLVLNQYQWMFGVKILGTAIQVSWGTTLNTWVRRGCNHVFITSNKLMPLDQWKHHFDLIR